MPMTYRPQKVSLVDQMRALSNLAVSPDVAPFRDAMMGLLDSMVDATNLEFGRVASSVNGGGGEKTNTRTTSTTGDISSTDGTVFGDTTTAPVVLTLPRAEDYPGMRVCVKRSTGANTLTVAPRGTDTIDGGGGVTVTTPQWFQSLGSGGWSTV